MEWFHFSDFHIGNPRGPQSIALASLLDAVEIACENGSGNVDAVFITGDIAYSGKADQYEKFRDDFLLPLKKLKAFANAKVFAVPGNHDVDCDATLPVTWEGIGPRNRPIFFCENLEGVRVRNGRIAVFKAYMEFVKSNNIISPNPSEEVTSLFSDAAYPFDILSTNTAFFSDREEKASGEITPSPLDSIRYVMNKRTGQKPAIILAHHPVSCLLKAQQAPLTSFIKDKKAVFIHGHEHAPRATFGNDGTIRTLGFGASYLASLQEQSTAPYLNSFTHCCLDRKLELRSFSWHPASGVWSDTTATQLPECMPENNIEAGPGIVKFPHFSDSLSGEQISVPLSTVQRSAPRPTQLIPIDIPGEDMWKRLFQVSTNLHSILQKAEPNTRTTPLEDGKFRFELELEGGQRDLLIFISAVNHVLSSKEIESVNTELDTEGFCSATVISLGKISDDAHAMYLRLQARKPIEVLASEGLLAVADRLLSPAQLQALSALDAAKHSIRLLLGKDDFYLLIIDEEKSQREFHIVPGHGGSLPPTDPVVSRLRSYDPDFNAMPYTGQTCTVSDPSENIFIEDQYLTQCHSEYNVMKYAALANVGMRFTDLPLEDLYVNASASEVSQKATIRSEQLVDDHLAAYPVSDALKEHIQSELLTSGRQEERQETSRAREFCQKYSAVLITGDPGSGKTCFVKNEILTYCKSGHDGETPKEETVSNWHSFHVPVMVPLSAVVAEKDLEDRGLFVIASRLLERRGLLFPAEEISNLAKKGRIAFFFDGLDEVVSVEKRALVVKHINELVSEHLPAGNRFVVTSRPAAVQVVNLLPALHKLELQGLTEAEIRMLANRLLSLKLTASQNGVNVDEGTLDDSEHVLVSQLIADCNKSPGVARMAQNPLLLTLLIMIYANSGAPSAKRHRIYEEAIRTLASVRGREAGHEPISVQDLRERLGAVALSVYTKESGLLPVRSEVCDVVRSVMARQRDQEVSLVEANSFIQKVAESTGLIVLEAKQGENDNQAIVTFMHHSFLEYFAALGLSRELENIDIGSLVREPRWHEILTLLAGIIGENEDISPVIKKFLATGPSSPDVDAKLLLFAIDCALECEVPSEAAQRLLSNSIKECLGHGSGRLDSWVRSQIGQRLDSLLSVCGGSEFNGMLSDLIRTGDETVCAAAIGVVGHICANGYESPEILSAYEFACSRTDDAVLSAICAAASRSRTLRTDAANQVITSCLHKSRRNKRSAYEALAGIPNLVSSNWDEIINGINDNDAKTSMWASIAAMQAGLNVDVISLNATKKDVLFRALNQVDSVGGRDEFRHPQMKKDTLERLLASAFLRDKKLGIRLLPLAEGEENYIYAKLMDLVRGKSPREELVSALNALRWSGSVLALFTLGDLRTISNWLKDGTSDVRIEAARLLGYFFNDTIAVDALLSQDFDNLNVDEYCASIVALSRAKVALDQVRELFFNELGNYLDNKKKMNAHNLRRAKTLLDASRRLGEVAPTHLVGKVLGIIDDYRANDTLKRKALLCYPAITEPSQKTVENVTHLCLNPPVGMDAEIAQIPAILAKKCKSSVDYVIDCVGALSGLRSALYILHAKHSKRNAAEENEYCVSELRGGIEEVSQIIVAFQDFIGDGNSASELVSSD